MFNSLEAVPVVYSAFLILLDLDYWHFWNLILLLLAKIFPITVHFQFQFMGHFNILFGNPKNLLPAFWIQTAHWQCIKPEFILHIFLYPDMVLTVNYNAEYPWPQSQDGNMLAMCIGLINWWELQLWMITGRVTIRLIWQSKFNPWIA